MDHYNRCNRGRQNSTPILIPLSNRVLPEFVETRERLERLEREA